MVCGVGCVVCGVCCVLRVGLCAYGWVPVLWSGGLAGHSLESGIRMGSGAATLSRAAAVEVGATVLGPGVWVCHRGGGAQAAGSPWSRAEGGTPGSMRRASHVICVRARRVNMTQGPPNLQRLRGSALVHWGGWAEREIGCLRLALGEGVALGRFCPLRGGLAFLALCGDFAYLALRWGLAFFALCGEFAYLALCGGLAFLDMTFRRSSDRAVLWATFRSVSLSARSWVAFRSVRHDRCCSSRDAAGRAAPSLICCARRVACSLATRIWAAMCGAGG